jgi:hypothetical protein
MTNCSIAGCSNAALARGWCDMHYRRWRAHGDPATLLKKKSPNGELLRFYRESVVPYEGDECLLWPYGRNDSGYGHFQYQGRGQIVSRVLCEEANGPPPTPKHQAAHTCGRGHEGCVTRRHLAWKTAKDNQQDLYIHGTIRRGERNHNTKLTAENVAEIRRLHARGVTNKSALGRQFGVSDVAIHAVLSGRTWAYLVFDKEQAR